MKIPCDKCPNPIGCAKTGACKTPAFAHRSTLFYSRYDDDKHVALIEMIFDDKQIAKKWLSDAEDLDAKMNGELEDSSVEPA